MPYLPSWAASECGHCCSGYYWNGWSSHSWRAGRTRYIYGQYMDFWVLDTPFTTCNFQPDLFSLQWQGSQSKTWYHTSVSAHGLTPQLEPLLRLKRLPMWWSNLLCLNICCICPAGLTQHLNNLCILWVSLFLHFQVHSSYPSLYTQNQSWNASACQVHLTIHHCLQRHHGPLHYRWNLVKICASFLLQSVHHGMSQITHKCGCSFRNGYQGL